jgi:hypothetical protein
MAETDRQFIDFFGVYLYDWIETFGSFVNTHLFMLREYESDGCSWMDSSEASDTHNFLYPFDLERIYYLEGTAKGQITLVAVNDDAVITDYRVTICKTYEGMSSPDEELATTGWRTVNDTLPWDAVHSVGEEMVYPFRIHISPEKQVTEHQRLYIKVEVNCNQYTHLMHSNDAKWEDVYISIPFKGL